MDAQWVKSEDNLLEIVPHNQYDVLGMIDAFIVHHPPFYPAGKRWLKEFNKEDRVIDCVECHIQAKIHENSLHSQDLFPVLCNLQNTYWCSAGRIELLKLGRYSEINDSPRLENMNNRPNFQIKGFHKTIYLSNLFGSQLWCGNSSHLWPGYRSQFRFACTLRLGAQKVINVSSIISPTYWRLLRLDHPSL